MSIVLTSERNLCWWVNGVSVRKFRKKTEVKSQQDTEITGWFGDLYIVRNRQLYGEKLELSTISVKHPQHSSLLFIFILKKKFKK